MLETIVYPYGKAAFPTVVKCDGCGEVIEYGGWSIPGSSRHYCDWCREDINLIALPEFRICDRCGRVMWSGFCDDCDHICEDCWDAFVKETFPHGLRETPEDEYEDDDDFYQAYDPEHGWYAVGWYWTQWD